MTEHIPFLRLRAFRQGQIAAHLAACAACQREHAAQPEAAVVQWMCRDAWLALGNNDTSSTDPS